MKAVSLSNLVKLFKNRWAEVVLIVSLFFFFPTISRGQLTVDFIVSSTSVCSGSSVTFTDNTTNITGTPTYAWSFGAGATPATANTVGPHTVTYTGSGTVTITLTVTDDTGPISANKDITVNPDLPASVAIAASPATTICAGTSVTFTATPANGGTSPSYQWKLNGTDTGTDSPIFTSTTLANGDIVNVVMTSNATPCLTGSPATSNAITMVVYPDLPASITIAASPAGSICAGSSVTFTATPVNGGTAPSYQWKLNGTNTGTNSPIFTSTTIANGDIVDVVMTSNATPCLSGSPATSNAITMIVNPDLPASVTIAASPAGPICAGSSVTFTATPVNGGTAPSYQWKLNGTNTGTNSPVFTSTTLANGNIVTVVMTSNATPCLIGSPATSNAITMSVSPTLPVSVNISESPSGTLCAGTSITFTATPVNGGGVPSYQWKLNGLNVGTNNPTYISSSFLNNDAVNLVMTSSATCATGSPATSNSIVLSVTPTVGTPAVPSPSASAICQGSGITTYTTSASNATGYNWTVTGTGNTIAGTGTTGTVTWSPNFSGTATVGVTATGCNGPSALSSTTVTIRPTPTATISGTASVCLNANAPLITFTNPMTLPVIVTYNINGAGQTTIPVNASSFAALAAPTSTSGTFNYNLVSVAYETAPSCSNNISGTATVTVYTLPVPTLVSSVADNIFCAGTSVTFTAGGGTQYNFRVAGSSVQSGSSPTYTTTALSNGKVVDVIVTNANGCSATSAGITNFVNALPFIFVSSAPTCSADLLTYSLAVAVSAGTVTSTSGTVTDTGGNVWTITGVPAGTNITIKVTDGNGCVNSLAVTAPNCSCPVVQAPASGGDKSYCSSEPIPVLTATVPGGETTDWYSAPSGGTLLKSSSLSYTPASAGIYYAQARNITTGCVSSTRTSITLTMNPVPVPTLSSSDADNTFCAGTAITFTAGGGTGYNFRINGVSFQNGTSTTFTTSSLTPGQVVDVIVSNGYGCTATSSGISNSVIPNPVPGIISSAADNRICQGSPVTFYASGGSNYNFRIGGLSVQNGLLSTYTTSSLTDNQVVDVIVTNSSGCSATSSGITNTILPLPAPLLASSDADNIFCSGTFITFTSAGGVNYDFTVDGSSKQGGPLATFITNSLTNGQKVAVVITASNGCVVTTPPITNTVHAIPTANGGPGGSKCDLNFTFNAIPSIGTGTWTKNSGPGIASFIPNANTPSATVEVSDYGSYIFTWTEINNGCPSSSNVNVNFNRKPVANPGIGGNNCGLNFLLNAVPSVGIGTWTKTTGSGTAVFTPDVNTPNATVAVSEFGQYTFTWTEVNGTCSSNASVNINFLKIPSANAGSDAVTCGPVHALNAVPATIGSTGIWSKFSGPGDATFSPDEYQPDSKVTVTQYGQYEFLWTEINATCQSTDKIGVLFYPKPGLSSGNDTTVCKGNSAQLYAKGTGTFLWEPAALLNDPGISNPIATPTETTMFKVTLTDNVGCTNKDSTLVMTSNYPLAVAGPDQQLEYVFNTKVSAELPGSGESGMWSLVQGSGTIVAPESALTSVNGLSPGENILLWSVSNGVCPPSLDFVTIVVNDFVVPTLITPNMDGKNDYFVLRGIETLGKTELTIFDRRGVRVYNNSNYDNTWNGVDYNGRRLPDDTYFYTIKSENGKSISGYVVIR